MKRNVKALQKQAQRHAAELAASIKPTSNYSELRITAEAMADCSGVNGQLERIVYVGALIETLAGKTPNV